LVVLEAGVRSENDLAEKGPEVDKNVQPIDRVEVTGQESAETDSMMAGLAVEEREA
jgi:hypothetical protein